MGLTFSGKEKKDQLLNWTKSKISYVACCGIGHVS